ncbi:MAG: serine/threonine protein kinase [Pedosphaera sp.]|nr:serine/threonine protein kinase [Pedosphaera sp.]
MNPNGPPPGGDLSTAAETLAPSQMVGGGRYTLLWMIGHGGSSMLWLAQDERLGETVALKFLLPQTAADPRMLASLRQETLKCRRLAHRNVVQTYDLYEAPGEMPFIIMEHVDGPSLHTLRLEKPHQVFTWQFLEPIVKQLLEALEYAHGDGLVHRDLKPANLILDQRGRLKLADFGIAAMVDDFYTRVLNLRDPSGTVTFMSPQQMEGAPPAPPDDIYALGATLYELLTGQPPFYAGDIAHQVRHVAPQSILARLRQLKRAHDLPAVAAALIMACLQKDSVQRPQTPRAVAKWLGLHLGSEYLAPPYAQNDGATASHWRLTRAGRMIKLPLKREPVPSEHFWFVLSIALALLLVAAFVYWWVRIRAH